MLLPFTLAAALAVACAQSDPSSTKPPPPRREQFRVLYEWNTIDFEWPSLDVRADYLNSSRYIPKNVLVSGISSFGDNLFLTLPRMLNGVPATLATIPAQSKDTAPKLTPFPSWEANDEGNCSALQFVQNIEIDRNGMLWILDNGRVGTLTEMPSSKCRPSIVLVNLKSGTNQMERIPLPDSVVDINDSYLNDLVVDNRDGDYAYITDNSASDPGIIVFRRSDKKSWKLRDKRSMFSDPKATYFRINGTTVNLPVNIDGIALGPQFYTQDHSIDRTVYYSPLSSFHLYAVNASVLRKEELSSKGESALEPYVMNLGMKSSQTDGMKMDVEGNLFYGLIGNSSIVEWNTNQSFATGQRTIARDPNYIQWIDRFSFDEHGNLYVVINRLFNFVKDRVSPDEVNYRILKSHVGSRSYVYSELPSPAGSSAVTHGLSLMLLGVAYLVA